MTKNILVINGHPDTSSDRLCHAFASSYANGASGNGYSVDQINVAALEFPLLRTQKEFEKNTPCSAIVDAQQMVRRADHIVIIYPLWLGTMPALLKGFLEQVLRPGFAFTYQEKAFPKKGLNGKSARIVVTMGMPAFAYRWFYGAHSLKSLERNILKFCGIRPVRETLFGGVDTASDETRQRWLADVEELGRNGR